MRIRKLELHGFKSFPDRTTLHFDPGISCIVGPNGCGKSNVVDALRWCIGEQSARSLRGSQMQDVIFAGSQDRKPVGFAEVSITLTSEGGEPFPGEFAQMTEVSVGRRLHRTGAGEYFINQRRVRRRDIVDLFLDTGVGNNLYSFIEQGRIGKIVHARPEERRSLIDEAAGISRYKVRRDEARDRLTATSAQLDRAADVSDELARRVRSLSRQVVKAARYRRLGAQIRQDEITLGLARYAALAQDRRALRGRLRTAQGELATVERSRARREADVLQRREELAVVEAGVETWRDEVAELDARTRELEGVCAFADRRLGELAAQEARETATKERSAAEAASAAEASATAASDAEEAALEASSTAQALEAAEAERAALTAEGARADDEAREARSGASKALLEVERLASEAAELDRRSEALPERVAELARAVEAAQRSVEDARGIREVGAARALEARSSVDAREAARQTAREELDARLVDESEARSALARVEEERRDEEAARRSQRALIEARVAAAEEALRDARATESESLRAAEAAAREAAEEALDAVRWEAREALAGARERAAAWLDALDADARGTEARAVQTAESARAARGVARQAELLESRAEAEAAGTARVAEVEVAVAAELADAEGRVDGLRTGLREAQDADRRAHEAWRGADAELSRASAELDAIGASIDSRTQAESGRAAVSAAVPDASPLVERLSPEARDSDWVAAALGDRLAALVVQPTDLPAAVEAARKAGRATVVLRPRGALDATAAFGGVRVFDSLDQAVAAHLASGEAGLVRDTAERVDADGRVHLGPPDAAARELVAEVRRRDAARTSVDDWTELAAEARRAADVATAAVRAAELAVDEAVQQRLSIAARGADAVADARSAAADAVALAELEVRDRHAAELVATAALEEATLAGLRTRLDRRRAAALRARDEALDLVESGGEGRIEEARARIDGIAAEARNQAASQLRGTIQGLEGDMVEARDALAALQDEMAAADAALEARLAEVRAGAETARAAVEAARAASDDAVAAANTATVFQTRAEAAAEAARAAFERACTIADEAVARVESAQGEVAILATRRELVRERRRHVEAAAAEAAAAATAADAAQAQARARGEAANAAAAEARVLAATWSERQRSAREQHSRAVEATAEAQARVVAADAALAEVAEVRSKTVEERAEAERTLGNTQTARAEAWDRLQRERARMSELRDGVRTGEEDLRALTERTGELTRTVEQLRGQVDAVRSEIEALRTRIDERYQVSLPGLLDRMDAQSRVVLEVEPELSEPFELDGHTVEGVQRLILTPGALSDAEDIEARVERLTTARRDLDRLGDVHLGAVEEYAEVSVRHADLETQRADLEASVARIRTAIAKMNRTCRQRFRDTFDLVNENFQEMYPRLVGGGAARLSLTDEEDLLETGVDIFVQPPGKRLQNLSLLSGGEKAMTAIALILSLFRVKPSPFCVLDEVDAPLDEANGSRFNEALREMSTVSQFIVVTHNRKTMECAEALYGITMPAPGVSRLVSVSLGD